MNDQDLIDSLSAVSPLERINRAQVVSDVIAMLTGVGLVLATGIGLAFALFYMMVGVG